MVHEYSGKQVTIMCCSNCNTKCEHCYISYKGNFTGDALFHTACTLQKNGYEVTLNGTEPLMYREYLKTYKLVDQRRVLTNGLVFQHNYDYLDEIKSYGISALNISYHFDLHDQISSVSKDYIQSLWKEILARGMGFTINCTLSRRNMHKIVQYCNEALSYGAFRIRFTNLLNQGSANRLDRSLFLNGSDIDYVLDCIHIARGMFKKEELYIERCGSLGPNVRTPHFHCPAGVNRVFLTPDHKVYPCVFLTKPGFEIGFYKDEKIYIYDEFRNEGDRCLALLLNYRKDC